MTNKSERVFGKSVEGEGDKWKEEASILIMK